MSAADYRRPAPADSEAILNALPHPILVIAPDGKIVDANMSAESFFDISAQFLTSRESPHGALQRLVIGGTGLTAGASMGALPVAAGTMAAGRVANGLLNSNAARNMVLGKAPTVPSNGGLLGFTRVAPLLANPGQ